MRTHDSIPSPRRSTLLTLALLAGGMIAVAPLWAGSQTEESEEIRQTRIIRVAGPGGEHTVAHGYGMMGSRGYLGVEAVELTPELREHFGAPAEIGVLVSRVADGSPAQIAGLQVGDILTTVDEEPVDSFIDLFHEISAHEDGDSVMIEVWRDARVLAFNATLTRLERPQIDIRRFHLGPGGEHHALLVPDGDYDEVIELQAEAFDEAMDRLHEELSSEDWQERLHNYSSSQEELLERLEALENRLRELEGDLDDASSDEG